MFDLIKEFLLLLFENIKHKKEQFTVITLIAVGKEHIFVQEAIWIFRAVDVVRDDLGGSLTTVESFTVLNIFSKQSDTLEHRTNFALFLTDVLL